MFFIETLDFHQGWFHSISRIIWALCALVRKQLNRKLLLWVGNPQLHFVMISL